MDRDDGSAARDGEDLEPLLDDLRETLAALRSELDDGSARRPGASRDRRPRPPSPGELLRFTEEYTIPTLVALLETTVTSLELLGGVIRLVDPERPLSRRDAAASGSARDDGARSARGAAAALSELRRALREADLPPDGEARTVVEDARELSAELERRVAALEDRADGDRAGERRRNRRESGGSRDRAESVRIEVREADESGGEGGRAADAAESDGEASGADADDADEAGPPVDVEAELESIRDEVRRGSREGGERGGEEEGGEDERGAETGEDRDGEA